VVFSRRNDPRERARTTRLIYLMRPSARTCYLTTRNVRGVGRVDHRGARELDAAKAFEQSRAAPEQDRRQVQPELVHEPGPECLLNDVRAAGDADILGACGFTA
jgi:hypothetical protein